MFFFYSEMSSVWLNNDLSQASMVEQRMMKLNMNLNALSLGPQMQTGKQHNDGEK